MGLMAEPPEWFEGVVFGGPAHQWLALARVWGAAAAVLEGGSQSETELALRMPAGPTFWTWSANCVRITDTLWDQIIQVSRATSELGREVRAARCGRRFPREELPVASRRDLARVSALCHRRKANASEEPRQPEGCPLAIECLHSRLRSGVAEAREAIAALALRNNRLYARIKTKWPLADEQNVAEAIERAVLDYLGDPCRFDPEQGTALADFLVGGALRRLRDVERNERRRSQRVRLPGEDVLMGVADALETGPSPCDLVMAGEAAAAAGAARAWREQVLQSFARGLPATEREVLRLMLAGEREHGPYARVLGITGQQDSVQSKIVNRAKQRIHKGLQRLMNASPLP
jgi:DNA-directed RNA polymerase specialized sigma24 family protein